MCTLCLDLFSSRSELYNHRKLIHNLSASKQNENTLYRCDFGGCGKQFDQLRQFTRHKRAHLKLYKCDVCLKCLSSSYHLKIHQRIHFNDKCEICKYCNKKFTDPSTKRKHIKYAHLNGVKKKQEFHCHICKKVLTTKDGLTKHIWTHADSNDRVRFRCDKCPHETFSTKSNLEKIKRGRQGVKVK